MIVPFVDGEFHPYIWLTGRSSLFPPHDLVVDVVFQYDLGRLVPAMRWSICRYGTSDIFGWFSSFQIGFGVIIIIIISRREADHVVNSTGLIFLFLGWFSFGSACALWALRSLPVLHVAILAGSVEIQFRMKDPAFLYVMTLLAMIAYQSRLSGVSASSVNRQRVLQSLLWFFASLFGGDKLDIHGQWHILVLLAQHVVLNVLIFKAAA